MKYIKKTLPFLTLGAILMVIFSSCRKDDTILPEGAILLTTEKHQSQAKTSVSENTVQWVDGDIVWFYVGNSYPFDCPVVVNGQVAYVSDRSFPDQNNVIRAYYPSAICDEVAADQDLNLNTNNPTVVIPDRYNCHYDQGRQVLHLPLAATAAVGADKIEFKHLTAAVKVVIKNITDYDLTLDSVVVSSKNYLLSDTMKLDLTRGDFGIAARTTMDSNSVTVRFSDSPTLARGGSNETEVQVPIRPIGATTNPLRIEIFAHGQGNALDDSEVPTVYKTIACHYSNANSVSNLGRNIMITAEIALAPKNSTYPNSHTSLDSVDNSLFTINTSGTQVRFTKGNLINTNPGGWGFHGNQYDYFSTQTGTQCDIFQMETTSEWNSGAYRILTSEEWDYILNNTSRTANRFAKARLNLGNGTYVNGLIVFPDSYTQPDGIPLNHINAVRINTGTSTDAPYAEFNSYTLTQWTEMEQAGAVFLPAAHASGGEGHYWTPFGGNGSETGKRLFFSNYELTTSQPEPATNTCSIRPVKVSL